VRSRELLVRTPQLHSALSAGRLPDTGVRLSHRALRHLKSAVALANARRRGSARLAAKRRKRSPSPTQSPPSTPSQRR
jgi:hypothetical protein